MFARSAPYASHGAMIPKRGVTRRRVYRFYCVMAKPAEFREATRIHGTSGKVRSMRRSASPVSSTTWI